MINYNGTLIYFKRFKVLEPGPYMTLTIDIMSHVKLCHLLWAFKYRQLSDKTDEYTGHVKCAENPLSDDGDDVH